MKLDGQKVVSLTVRGLLFVASLTLLAIATRLSMEDKTASSTVTYTAAFICLFFVFLTEFSKFKGFGLEAELREKIKEADDVLQRLRRISLPISEMLFTMAARMGRWGAAIPRQDSYRITKEIEEELIKLGVERVEIEKSKHDWHRFNMRDLITPIYRRIGEKLDGKIRENLKLMEAIPQPIIDLEKYNELGDKRNSLSRHKEELEKLLQQPDWSDAPIKYERFINDCAALTDSERQELFTTLADEFADIRHYSKNHDFRRLEHWKKDD